MTLKDFDTEKRTPSLSYDFTFFFIIIIFFILIWPYNSSEL